MAVATLAAPWSFAELHARLGGIPLERIRMNPSPGMATEQDLMKPHGPICELIDGVLVEKPVGDRESLLGVYVSHLIYRCVEADGLGVVLGSDGFIKVGDGLIRAPDVTFIPWSSFPDEELPEEAYWSVAPGLIVEVLSPGNTSAEIDRKLNELFSAGCKLAWVIDPESKSARVFTSPKRFKDLDATGTLDGGKVLPGLKIPLADLFAATRRPKKKSR